MDEGTGINIPACFLYYLNCRIQSTRTDAQSENQSGPLENYPYAVIQTLAYR